MTDCIAPNHVSHLTKACSTRSWFHERGQRIGRFMTLVTLFLRRWWTVLLRDVVSLREWRQDRQTDDKNIYIYIFTILRLFTTTLNSGLRCRGGAALTSESCSSNDTEYFGSFGSMERSWMERKWDSMESGSVQWGAEKTGVVLWSDLDQHKIEQECSIMRFCVRLSHDSRRRMNKW